MTTGVGDEMPFVRVTPGTSSDDPPSAVRCRVDVNERGPVEAPTVVTHGPPWSEVPAPGPELAADAFTDEELAWIEPWIGQRGGGLCMIGGENSFASGG